MAKMDLTGFESVQARLDQIEQSARSGIAKQVLEAGAKVYVEQWMNSINMRGHVRSGNMRDSVKVVSVEESTGGKWIATIKPDGYDDRGVANDLKMNMLVARTDKQVVRQAEKAAKPLAEAAMQAALDKIVSGKE